MGWNLGKRARISAYSPVVVLASALAFSGVARAENPEGTWRMNDGKITVRVNYCGGEKICATIVGMAKPLDKHGNPKTDKENPNPSLRSRPIMGLQVVSGMKPDGDGAWSGTIYNADDGETYQGTAAVSGETLVIKACVLGGLACKKKRFTRAN